MNTPTEEHAEDEGPAQASPLSLHVDYYQPHTVVLAARGQLDDSNVAHFAEVLRCRLTTAVRTIVIDLRDLTFLGVPALDLLGRAHVHTTVHGQHLLLMADHPEVLRALQVASLAHLIEHPDVDAALAAIPAQTGTATAATTTHTDPPTRSVTTHVADHTEPCQRCGRPTAQRALLDTGAGHTRRTGPLCGDCAASEAVLGRGGLPT